MPTVNVDDYSFELINKSKRFNEKAKEETDNIAISAYLQASLILAIMSLETTIYSISEELCMRDEFTLLEKSLLLEKKIIFEKGKYVLNDKLKMSRLTDKIDFLLCRFNYNFDKNKNAWWTQLNQAIRTRNELIHSKSIPNLTQQIVNNAILSVLKCTDVLFMSIYHKKYPHFNKSLVSSYDF